MICGSSLNSMNAPKTVQEMNLSELKTVLETKQNALSNRLVNKQDIEKQIKEIQERIQQLEVADDQKQNNPIEKSRKPISTQQKTFLVKKKAPSTIHINDITDIKKIVALNKDTPILLCKKSDDTYVIKKIVDGTVEDVNVPKTKTKLFKDSDPIIQSIAAYNNQFAIAAFYQKKVEGFFGDNEKTESVIFYSKNGMTNYKDIPDAHKTEINDLFMDDEYIVSQSKAGNIRFFDIKYNIEKQGVRETGDIAHNAKTVDPDAEYKAKNLIFFGKKWMVTGEKTTLFGDDLYATCINDTADIVAQKKIGTYNKNDDCPYIANIHNKNKDILIYDQRSRSLIYARQDNLSIKPNFFARNRLPQDLVFKVAKQIYYINDNVLLIYDDEIISFKLQPNIHNPDYQILFKVKDLQTLQRNVIHSTAYAQDTLWIVRCETSKKNDKEYVVESIKVPEYTKTKRN